jgi:hypothetical protein
VRVIVAGSRRGRPDHELVDALVLSGFTPTEFVLGGAQGVDAQADALARSMDIPITTFRANWAAAGRAAGPIRNRRMAEYAAEDDGALIALHGGDGTASMIREARRQGLKIYIHNPPASEEEWTS